MTADDPRTPGVAMALGQLVPPDMREEVRRFFVIRATAKTLPPSEAIAMLRAEVDRYNALLLAEVDRLAALVTG